MNTITTTYATATTEDLVAGIKNANSKAKKKGLEMIGHMKSAGFQLIELKKRIPHGNFMNEVKVLTNLEHRTATRYMEMAKGIKPHRTLKDGERDTRKDYTTGLIRATDLIDEDSEMDTVSTLPPPAPRPSPAHLVIDAEIVEPSPPKPLDEEPEAVVEDGPTRRAPIKVIEDEGMNIWFLAKSHLDRINQHDTQRVAALTDCIQYCQGRLDRKSDALPAVLATLPRLTKSEILFLSETLKTRWL